LPRPTPVPAEDIQVAKTPTHTPGQRAPNAAPEASRAPTLTAAQLQVAAEEKARELEEIKRKLNEAREAEKGAFIGYIRHEILESGFDYDAVVSALANPVRRASQRYPVRARGLRLRTDHSCTYYGRGQLPRCAMEAMQREGLDPASRSDRTRFLREFMEPVS